MITTRYHYSKKDIVNGLKKLGIRRGDTIFTHSNIGFFGIPDQTKTADGICQLILESFFEVIGDNGTLAVPTFTYSFAKDEVFSMQETASNCGIFSEYIRKQKNACRSFDPSVSVACIGMKSLALTKNIPINSYGRECFWERFLNEDGKILNMNFDAGSTFVHYVERTLRVPYRFDKEFSGFVKKTNSSEKELAKSIIWVRDLKNPITEADFTKLNTAACNEGYYVKTPVGRGFLGAIDAQEKLSLIKKHLKKDPNFLVKGVS